MELAKQWQQVCRACKNELPTDFLTKIKKYKNQYVTTDDMHLLHELQQKSPLNDEMINFLFYYSYIIRKHSQLQANYCHRLGTDWSQKGFKTVEDIAYYLQQKAYSNVSEILPKSITERTQVPQLSKEKQQQVEDALRELRRNEKA